MTPAQNYVLGYVRERSKVTSQHKLPTRNEVGQIGVGYFRQEALEAALDWLVGEGLIVKMGPYYSTEFKEVL